jgi:hypothetical protein
MAKIAIRVNGQHWLVPYGFGRIYREVALTPKDPSALRDLLLLVGYRVPLASLQRWPLRKRVEAEVHASVEHLRASDNAIKRHPRPAWMPEPFRGPRSSPSRFSPRTETRLR